MFLIHFSHVGGKWKCNTDKQFQCTNDYCISLFKQCDGKADCTDKSDEKLCRPKCQPNYFYCGNGQCVPNEKTCNFFPDCRNLADETFCSKISYFVFSLSAANHRTFSDDTKKK